MGLDFGVLRWGGRRALLIPLIGVALGSVGALLAPHYVLVAILWTLAAMLPHESDDLSKLAITTISSGIARWILLGWFGGSNILACFIAVETVPRAAMIAIAWTSRPENSGRIDPFLARLTTPVALGSIAIGAIAALASGTRAGIVIILGCYLLIRAIRWFSYRMISGINAETLGITQLLSELLVLFLFGCASCRLVT